MIFFSNRDLGLTNSKLNTALRSKGTDWALGFVTFSKNRISPLKSKLKRIKNEWGRLHTFIFNRLNCGLYLKKYQGGK